MMGPTCPEYVLVMADRAGIEIDYCPNCRGVWLDRGELDKIIERSAAQPQSARRDSKDDDKRYEKRDDKSDDKSDDKYDRKYDDKYDSKYPRKKKSSFLGEIFDF